MQTIQIDPKFFVAELMRTGLTYKQAIFFCETVGIETDGFAGWMPEVELIIKTYKEQSKLMAIKLMLDYADACHVLKSQFSLLDAKNFVENLVSE